MNPAVAERRAGTTDEALLLAVRAHLDQRGGRGTNVGDVAEVASEALDRSVDVPSVTWALCWLGAREMDGVWRRVPDELDAIIPLLAKQERLALAYLAHRIHAGQLAYGELDLANDPRDFEREAVEEDADGDIYRAYAALKQRLRRPQEDPPMTSIAEQVARPPAVRPPEAPAAVVDATEVLDEEQLAESAPPPPPPSAPRRRLRVVAPEDLDVSAPDADPDPDEDADPDHAEAIEEDLEGEQEAPSARIRPEVLRAVQHVEFERRETARLHSAFYDREIDPEQDADAHEDELDAPAALPSGRDERLTRFRRERRKREVRATSINVDRFPKGELRLGAALYPEQPGVDYQRPATRGECVDGPRPCPFVSCQHHLYLDVDTTNGTIKINFPDVDVEDLDQLHDTCVLDVADRGGVTLEVAGELVNVTRERIRQIEEKAFGRLKRKPLTLQLAANEGLIQESEIAPRRRLPMLPVPRAELRQVTLPSDVAVTEWHVPLAAIVPAAPKRARRVEPAQPSRGAVETQDQCIDRLGVRPLLNDIASRCDVSLELLLSGSLNRTVTPARHAAWAALRELERVGRRPLSFDELGALFRCIPAAVAWGVAKHHARQQGRAPQVAAVEKVAAAQPTEHAPPFADVPAHLRHHVKPPIERPTSDPPPAHAATSGVIDPAHSSWCPAWLTPSELAAGVEPGKCACFGRRPILAGLSVISEAAE